MTFKEKLIVALIGDAIYALKKDYSPEPEAERIIKHLEKAIKIMKERAK